MNDLSYQPYRSPNGWYMLAYPEYWEVEVIEEIPAFTTLTEPEHCKFLHSKTNSEVIISLRN